MQELILELQDKVFVSFGSRYSFFVGNLQGYGKTVIINSGDLDFLFAHLADLMLSREKYDGQIIGEIGDTGGNWYSFTV